MSSLAPTPLPVEPKAGGYKGLVEKLFESHGFIIGNDNRRYVFHYNHCLTERESLKIGDSVDFDLVTDRRSRGGLRVTNVSKVYRQPLQHTLPSSSALAVPQTGFSGENLPQDLPDSVQAGFVFLVPRDNNLGSIACQVPGGSYFPSFSFKDLEDEADFPLVVYGRKVHCFFKLDQHGTLKAVNVVPEASTCKGIVACVNDDCCVIDRCDVKEQVLFRNSKYISLKNGDCVEFVVLPKKSTTSLQEVCRLKVLLPGSVKIYDVLSNNEFGVITRLPQSVIATVPVPNCDQTNNLSGCEPRAVNDTCGLLAQLGLKLNENSISAFGGSSGLRSNANLGTINWKNKMRVRHSLCLGDTVRFRLRCDCRTLETDAIDIKFDSERSFENSSEKREQIFQGFIESVGANNGVIVNPLRRNRKIEFDSAELIDADNKATSLAVGAGVAFTTEKIVLPGNVKRFVAKRIELLPKGSISLDWQIAKYKGVVLKLADSDKVGTLGIIKMIDNNCSAAALGDQMVGFKQKDIIAVNGSTIQLADEVEFCLCPRVNGYRRAIDIRLWPRLDSADTDKTEKFAVHKVIGQRSGYVTLVKDKYGFIELSDHSQSCFFHYSTCQFETTLLKFKLKVRFDVVEDAEGNLRAQNVELADASDFQNIASECIMEAAVGTVSSELKLSQYWNSKASDEATYVQVVEGKIEVLTDSSEKLETVFTLSSLEDLRILPKQGAQVQCCIVRETIDRIQHPLRAEKILPLAELCEAVVDSLKGEFGFLDHRVNAKAKGLFFHSAELQNTTMSDLKVGDTVQFLIWENKKKGKWQAIQVKKIRSGNGISNRKKTFSYTKPDTGTTSDAQAIAHVDTRPEHLKKWQSSKSAAAGDPKNLNGDQSTVKNGSLSTGSVGEVIIVRDPLFAPNLDTKGFAIPRQLRKAGVLVV